jgi:hypothetical protein
MSNYLTLLTWLLLAGRAATAEFALRDGDMVVFLGDSITAARTEHDVVARGARGLILAYGCNDIGWGTKVDAAHCQQYFDAVRNIVEQSRHHKILLTWLKSLRTAACSSG